MKINWNKRYTTYAIYAAIVCAAVIFCIFIGVYIGDIWAAFSRFLNVISPLFYGAVIAYIMNPLMNLWERKVFNKVKSFKVKRGLSVFVTYLIFIGAISILIYAVVPQLSRSFSDLQARLGVYSTSLQDWVNNTKEDAGILAPIVQSLSQYIDFSAFSQPLTDMIETSSNILNALSPYLVGFMSSFMAQLIKFLIGLIFAGYILYSKELLKAQIEKFSYIALSESRIFKIKEFMTYTDKTFGKYLIGAMLDAIVVGLVTFIFMLIFGVPYAPLVACIIGITNIIPIFGPFIGAIPSFFFIFLSSPIKAIWFAIIILVIQQIDGNIIAPRIHSGSTGMPAIAVITAIIVMGGFFGIFGMIIGVPLFAVIINYIKEKTASRIKEKIEKEGGGKTGTDGSEFPDTGVFITDDKPKNHGAAVAEVQVKENGIITFFRELFSHTDQQKSDKKPSDKSEKKTEEEILRELVESKDSPSPVTTTEAVASTEKVQNTEPKPPKTKQAVKKKSTKKKPKQSKYTARYGSATNRQKKSD